MPAKDTAEPEQKKEKAWVRNFFDSASARNGGVIRQSVREMTKHVSREELADAVYDRCFHMIETSDQFIIVCNSDPMKVYC